MAITVTSEPYDFNWVGSPIAYTLTSNSAAEVLEIGVQLHVELVLDSGTYTKVWEGTAPVNDAGQTTWELRDLLALYLKPVWPSLSAAGKVDAALALRWRLATYEVEDGVATPPADLAVKTTFPGGRGWIRFTQQTFPADYLFMSRLKPKRLLHIKQRDWLFVLPMAAGSAPLTATLKYSDGTTNAQSISLGSYAQYRPFYVPIDFITHDWDAVEPGKLLLSIDFQIGTGEKITALVDRSARMHTQTVLYQNSLGGVDVMYCTGRNEKMTVPDSLLSDSPAQADDALDKATLVPYGIESAEQLVVRSGYKLKATLSAMADLHRYGQVRVVEKVDEEEFLIPYVVLPETVRHADGNEMLGITAQLVRAVDSHYPES